MSLRCIRAAAEHRDLRFDEGRRLRANSFDPKAECGYALPH
jgi:hypothetical protein